MATKIDVDDFFDENSESLKGPFRYLEVQFPQGRKLITLARDDYGALEFELWTSQRCRQPLAPEFTYAVCELMAQPYLHRQGEPAKLLVRACRKAMRTIGRFGLGDFMVWREKLEGEIKVVFFAYALLNDHRNIHGVSACSARGVLRRLKRIERDQAKRSR